MCLVICEKLAEQSVERLALGEFQKFINQAVKKKTKVTDVNEHFFV